MAKLSEEALNDIAKRAAAESAFYSCSRCVVYGLYKYFDFITDDLVRASVLLAGGGDKATVGSCGAFSGGLMVLGAKYTPSVEEPTAKEMEEFNKRRHKLHEFRDWFLQTFGGFTCKDVQCHQLGRSFNFMDTEETMAYVEFPGVDEKCAAVYTKAALKVADMLTRED